MGFNLGQEEGNWHYRWDGLTMAGHQVPTGAAPSLPLAWTGKRKHKKRKHNKKKTYKKLVARDKDRESSPITVLGKADLIRENYLIYFNFVSFIRNQIRVG